MKTKIFFFSLATLYILSGCEKVEKTDPSPPIKWGVSPEFNASFSEHSFNYIDADVSELTSIKKLQDNSFILTGFYYPSTSYTLLKLNKFFYLEWMQDIEGMTRQVLESMDGGYILAGAKSHGGSLNHDGFLWKTDVNGEKEWENYIGTTLDDEHITTFIPTSDNGYLLTGGITQNDPDSQSDLFIAKVNGSGIESWSKVIELPGENWGSSIAEVVDEGFVVLGTSSNSTGSNSEAELLLVKINNDGDVLWTKSFGSILRGYYNKIITSDEGGFAITATSLADEAYYNILLFKVDEEGNLDWTAVLGSDEEDLNHSIIQANNGDYVILGETRKHLDEPMIGAEIVDIILIRTNPLGEVKWMKKYGSTILNDVGLDIIKTDEDDFIICGYSGKLQNFEHYYWPLILHTDAEGKPK